MKKLFLTLALATSIVVVNAQDMTSKRGVQILPEADEWAIGFDATPFFSYFSSLFSKETITVIDPVTGIPITISTGTSSPSFDFTRGQSIWIKKVRDEGFHYRGSIRIGFGSTTDEAFISNDATTDPNDVIGDERSMSMMNIALGAGFEMRRGKGRLQGYYGPELIVGFGSSSTEYTYGNQFSSSNPSPTFWDWDNNMASSGTRTTEEVDGSTFMLQLRGFVGLEYFFAPKLSIGGEFGWGLGLNSTGEGERTTQSWDPIDTTIETNTAKTGSSSTFSIDTDNVGGAIRLVGYF